jgi:bifunctional DNA primase/polymerase-like protein
MAGIATATAEVYAKFNNPTLPLGDDKNPLVGNFKIAKLTMHQSRAYLRRRPEADVLGVPDGPLSGIVRLDIDEPGVTAEVIRRAGQPGAMARTPSGKHHLWYANNNERRLTGRSSHRNARPWNDLKVDLCGMGGYAISPPSRLSNGTAYAFEGDVNLEDLLRNRHRLPIIKGLPDRAYVQPAVVPLVPKIGTDHDALSEMRVGSGRNVTLFDALCKVARRLPATLDAFVNWAREHNGKFGEPMTDTEVIKTASSVFAYLERGELRTGEHGAWFKRLQAQQLARDPYLFALIAWLKAENGPESEFLVADGLSEPKHLDWPRERLQLARRRAIADGWIVQIRKPVRRCAALYRWGPTAKGHQA